MTPQSGMAGERVPCGAAAHTCDGALPPRAPLYPGPMATLRRHGHDTSVTAPGAPEPSAAALADLVPPDVDLHAGTGLRHPEARRVWFGVVWGRLGRGDLAAAHLDRVTEPTLQPWIVAERGRLRRELGDHAGAQRLEEPALQLAEDDVDRAMLLLSLAADAVGLGDAELARNRLTDARRLLEERAAPGPRADRQRLRATWVEVEVAWMMGRVPDASVSSRLPRLDGAGAVQVPDIYRAGSRFHLAKGLLFAGVVHGDVRLLAGALEHAPPALWWAVQLARGAAGVAGAEEAGRRARAAVVPLPC